MYPGSVDDPGAGKSLAHSNDAGLSMFFLAREFVGSALAAFVAGLLFALAPARTSEIAHPFAYADLWTPAALLMIRLQS